VSKPAKPKQPRIAESIGSRSLGARVPMLAGDRDAYLQHHPVICLTHVDRGGPFSWERIKARELEQVVAKLRLFFAERWRTLLKEHKKHFHEIAVDKLAHNAQKRLEKLDLDVDSLLDVRIGKRMRVWLARYDHYAFPLWWDPQHLVYPMDREDNRNDI